MEIRKILKLNDITYQNLWDFIKKIPGRKFITLSAYVRIEEKLEISELSNQFTPEKEH